MTLSLPSAVRIWCIAISEPIASPSGFSCVTTISLLAERSWSRTVARSVSTCRSLLVILDLLVDQLRDSHPSIDRIVVLEGERRGVLETQRAREPRLQEAVGHGQRTERLRPLCLGPENAHVHARVAQVRACLDLGHRHKSHPGVGEVFRDRLAEHGTYRLVDSTHPCSGHPIPHARRLR